VDDTAFSRGLRRGRRAYEAVASTDGSVLLELTQFGNLIARSTIFQNNCVLPLQRYDARLIALSGNGNVAASAGRRSISIWDITAGTANGELPSEKPALGLALSADGKLLAVAYTDSIEIWDVEHGLRICHLPLVLPDWAPLSMTFSGDGKLLAIGWLGIDVWDLEHHSLRSRLSGHRGFINCLAFDSNRPLSRLGQRRQHRPGLGSFAARRQMTM
jgi:WD40 repeat protein